MPTKHCSFANCTADNRYPEENVFFIPFVKPHIDNVRCKKWIHASRRVDLTEEKITKYTYVCSKHFIGKKGPTIENPDPVAATISEVPKARKRRRLKNNNITHVNKSQCQNVLNHQGFQMTKLQDDSQDPLYIPTVLLDVVKSEMNEIDQKSSNNMAGPIFIKVEDNSDSPAVRYFNHSKYFIGNKGPTNENPDPITATINKIPNAEKICLNDNNIERANKSSKSVCQKVLNFQDFEMRKLQDFSEDPLHIPTAVLDIVKTEINETDQKLSNDMASQTCNPTAVLDIVKSEINETDQKLSNDMASQTCNEVEGIYIKKLQNEITILREKLSNCTLNVESSMKNPKKFKFYTSFMPEDFDILWNFLGPPTIGSLEMRHSRSNVGTRIAKRHFRAISLKNQLFLTLVRLRGGFSIVDLGFRFGISSSYVSKIILTWIQLMDHQFKKLNFPSESEIGKKFKNLRIAIDSFE